MSTIQFARERFTWSNEIVNSLQQGCQKMLSNQLESIVKDHHRLTGATGYTSDGMGYFAKPMAVFTLQYKPYGVTLAPLHASLAARHSDWLSTYEDFNRNGKRVSQTLLSLLGKAENAQDVRDMLPDIAYRAFPGNHPLNLLTRSRPDLYACGLEDPDAGHWDPKMVSNYASISSLVDTYIGYSLL